MTRLLAILALLATAPAFAAPRVSMSMPSSGSLYLAPATLAVSATASTTSPATVTKVDFYASGNLIQTVTSAPYQFQWSNVAGGAYSITAVVTDSTGATATSSARSITVNGTNTPPTLSLSAPADNSRYLNPSGITISANASGPELNDLLQSVQFYLNGSLVQTITSAPFSYSATGLAVGTYTLTAVATDSQGAQTTSATRTFTVSNTNVPPTVSLVIPQDGTRWNSPATVTFQASVNSGEANDTVSVEFFANGVSQGVRGNSPFSLSASLPAATYTITAVATDGQGAQTTAASRTIVVSDTNLPPTVAITSPTANANFPNPPIASISIATSTTAGEINGWLTKVEFYANNVLIGTKTSGPWNFTWTNVAQGLYSLTAIAYDNFNASTTSAPVNISVGPQPGQLFFISTDHLNTPRVITDANQQVRWRWDQQEPFGVNFPDENPAALGALTFPLRFPGQYADKETNLGYNYYRNYDLGVGRYIESDPIGLRGGLNRYAYVRNNPTRSTDRYGLVVIATIGPAMGLSIEESTLISEVGNGAMGVVGVGAAVGAPIVAGTVIGGEAVVAGEVSFSTVGIIARIINLIIKGVPDNSLPPPPTPEPPPIIRQIPTGPKPNSGSFCPKPPDPLP